LQQRHSDDAANEKSENVVDGAEEARHQMMLVHRRPAGQVAFESQCRRMDRRDAWQAVEVGRVQGQNLGQAIREE
jgi:hypothetical protein